MSEPLNLAELAEQLEARRDGVPRPPSRPWEAADRCPRCGNDLGTCAASGAHDLPPVRFSDYNR